MACNNMVCYEFEHPTWKNFVMNLGGTTQRKEFKNGDIPKNARCL